MINDKRSLKKYRSKKPFCINKSFKIKKRTGGYFFKIFDKFKWKLHLNLPIPEIFTNFQKIPRIMHAKVTMTKFQNE